MSHRRMSRALFFLLAGVCAAFAQTPKGLRFEKKLPSRYPYVAADVLRHCQPHSGFWIDLGAGKGQVALELIKKTGNPVVMLDPDAAAMAEGLRIARQQGFGNRLFAVVGVAEEMPFPSETADLVVSRGSIFFWDNPVKGLREVYRVLRPGGKAYIGGGAGSGYPAWAVRKLIEHRRKQLCRDEAEKWRRFVARRRPEQMRRWAEAAELPGFAILGKGALSAEDARVGQGVWLLFGKPQESESQRGATSESLQ